MDFSNLEYWLVAGAGIAGFLATAAIARLAGLRTGNRIHKVFLVLIGFSALGYASAETLAVFLSVCIAAYAAARIAAKSGRRESRIVTAIAVPVLFIPLAWFKYRNFAMSAFGFGNAVPIYAAIPVGISFYTFQAVGFVIDSARGRGGIPSFLDFLCFESFAPQIVAGPIERGGALLPQMKAFKFRWRTVDVSWGLRYVVLGLFFKLCLGDNLALCHSPDPKGNVFALWLDNVVFGLRIYFDFCGYGLSAYGCARCLGVKLTQNFASPYSAADITDFWRRWHKSLTNWFRDYVYFPLGGGRTKHWALNILAVFALSGLWHGASWNFVLWGFANGVALVIHKCFSRKLGLRMPRPVARLVTLAFVFYSWMLFDVTDLGQLADCHRLLFDPANYSKAAFLAFPGTFETHFVLSAFLLPLCAAVIFCERVCTRRKRNPYAMLLSLPALCAEIFLTFQLNSGIANEFIYFAF